MGLTTNKIIDVVLDSPPMKHDGHVYYSEELPLPIPRMVVSFGDCKFLNNTLQPCNHIGTEEGIHGCIAYLLSKLVMKESK